MNFSSGSEKKQLKSELNVYQSKMEMHIKCFDFPSPQNIEFPAILLRFRDWFWMDGIRESFYIPRGEICIIERC